eukprot:SAG31_NODE_4812_length_2942_cov_1.217024_3_plen_135_part_00
MGLKSSPVPMEDFNPAEHAGSGSELYCRPHTDWTSSSHPKRLPIRIIDARNAQSVVDALRSLQGNILSRGRQQWLLDIDEDYFFPDYSPAVPLATVGFTEELEEELADALGGETHAASDVNVRSLIYCGYECYF